MGGILAILGVVAAPITTGDTAFRSARLIVADFLKIGSEKDHKPNLGLFTFVHYWVHANTSEIRHYLAIYVLE